MIAFEVCHYLKRKRQGKVGSIALKIDMSKAYDRIGWKFLQNMMLKFGFHARWVDLIMKCVSTIRYFISHKGKDLGPIHLERGLHQGDPISPYLFIFCVEGLSCFLNDMEIKGLIHECKIVSLLIFSSKLG